MPPVKRNLFFFIVVILFLVAILYPTTPPFSFPSGSVIVIPEGVGLYKLAEKLEEDKVIRSPLYFRTFAIALGGERDMKAGEYYMFRPQSSFVIAWRIFHGEYDVETVKITIPEGFTVKEISELFDERFILFDRVAFELQALDGYLFPDTYFIQVMATASSTIKLLQDNFERRISGNILEIESSGKTLHEIITMASLLEAEAKTKEDREIASDILWKRLKLGMPLQVDSEMGTYEFYGLPGKPINNPGLVSIEAAIHPTSTPYLYFLTGEDGQMHYAKTFDEHKANKAKYLHK